MADKKEEAGIVRVDLNEVALLTERGKDIVFTPDAEEALVKLLELEEMIAKAKETAKKLIEEAALAYNPNFKSVQGDRIKAGYQMFGAKYTIDPALLEKIPQELYRTHVSYRPIGEAVDKFANEKGGLPLGINPVQRTKQVTFRRLDDFKEVEGES